MQVNVYIMGPKDELGSTPDHTDQDFRDFVPEDERGDARYNLEKYGRYWVYGGTGQNLLLMRS